MNVLSEVSNPKVPIPDTGVKGSNPLSPESGRRLCTPAGIILTDRVNLADILPPPMVSPTACTPKFRVFECGCGRHIRPLVCDSKDCIVCQPYITMKRAYSVFDRFTGALVFNGRNMSFRPVIYSVFTVPVSIRERYYDRHAWQKVRLKIWKVLKAKFGAKFGVEVSHPVGEDTTVFHPHLNFLWVQKNGWSPFIDVNLLQTAWSGILGVEVSDVHTEYAGNEAQVMSWCKYVCRTFPGMSLWQGSMRWYGKYPRNKHLEEYLCPECGQPFKLIGYLETKVVEDYNKRGFLTGIDPPWYRSECIIPICVNKRKTNVI